MPLPHVLYVQDRSVVMPAIGCWTPTGRLRDTDEHGASYGSGMGTSLVLLVIGLVVGALAGFAGAVARRASQPGDELGALRAQAAGWQARAEELSRRVEHAEARAAGDDSVLNALAPVRSQLEQMSQRVDRLERARPHGALAEQLREAAQREAELAHEARGARSSSPESWRHRG